MKKNQRSCCCCCNNRSAAHECKYYLRELRILLMDTYELSCDLHCHWYSTSALPCCDLHTSSTKQNLLDCAPPPFPRAFQSLGQSWILFFFYKTKPLRLLCSSLSVSISELGLDLDCLFSYKTKPLRVLSSSLSENISELGFDLDSFFSTKQNLCDCCYALLTRSRALATRAESDEKRQRRVWCHCCQLSHGTCRIPSAPPLLLHKATTTTETHQKKPHKNLPKPSSRSTQKNSQKLTKALTTDTKSHPTEDTQMNSFPMSLFPQKETAKRNCAFFCWLSAASPRIAHSSRSSENLKRNIGFPRRWIRVGRCCWKGFETTCNTMHMLLLFYIFFFSLQLFFFFYYFFCLLLLLLGSSFTYSVI